MSTQYITEIAACVLLYLTIVGVGTGTTRFGLFLKRHWLIHTILALATVVAITELGNLAFPEKPKPYSNPYRPVPLR
jgi:hypothetical protein